MNRNPDGTEGRRRVHLFVAWVGFVALVLLHLDFWRPSRPVLYFGWLPEEMAYRLVWMGLASLYLLHYCAFVWPEDEEESGGTSLEADDDPQSLGRGGSR